MVYLWIPESNSWTCVLRDVLITLVAAVFVIASNSIRCSSTVDCINEIGVHSQNAVLHDTNGWTTATLHKWISQICFSKESRNKRHHNLWFHLCKVKSKQTKIKQVKCLHFVCIHYTLTPNMPIPNFIACLSHFCTHFHINLECFWFWV